MRETVTSWIDHKAPRMGAALSYYTAFALAPLLVLVFSIASLIWTKNGDAAAKITSEAQDLIGPQSANAVEEILNHASLESRFSRVQNGMSPDQVKYLLGEPNYSTTRKIPLVVGTETDYVYTDPKTGKPVTVVFKNDKVTDRNGNSSRAASWGTIISIIVLVFSASSAFGELQDSLNQIWEVEPKQHSGFLVMIKDRALSFAMVFILGFFMLVSLLMSTIIAAVSRMLVTQIPLVRVEFANAFLSFVVFMALFATIFRLLPDVPIKYRDVWPGAIFSTVLFMVGKVMLGWYIGRSSTYSMYGAAGSFAIILLWVYYSAQILYLGAEFTRAYTKRYGSHSGAAPAKS